jgi:hypothetical protein
MKDKKKKKTPRQVAAEKLLALYAKLTPYKRGLLQDTLLQHVFLSTGGAYIEWDEWKGSPWVAAYTGLMDAISQDVAEAWSDWAAELWTESWSTQTLIILALVGDFVCLRFLESHQSQATAEVSLRAPQSD